MNRFLPVTLLLFFGAIGVLARDIEDGPVTFMGQGLLTKSDLVVRGSIQSVSRLSAGPAVAGFMVQEVLWGKKSGESDRISLFTADPGSFPRPEVIVVYFLRRLSRGRFEPVGRVDLTGREGQSRLDTLRRYLEIEAMKDRTERCRALHDLLFKNLASEDAFKVFSAARELAHFSEISPENFGGDDRKVLEQKLSLARNRLLIGLLETTLGNLGDRPALPLAAAPEGAEPLADAPVDEVRPALPVARPDVAAPAPTDAFRDLEAAWRRGGLSTDQRRFVVKAVATKHLAHAGPILLDALGDSDREVRWIAAMNLGEGLVEEAKTPLLRLLATEKVDRVLEAAIQSLGVLQSEEALAPIVEFARNPAFIRSVAFAAARIGGVEAKAFLDRLRATHAGAEESDVAIRDLVDFLRSEDFAKQEQLLRKIRERRLRGG